MSNRNKVLETRTITREEAERCANEQVQFIGSVQPHGFLLVVDIQTRTIVQYSANLFDLLSSVDPSTPVLDSSLHDWVSCDIDTPFANLMYGAMQIFEYGEGGRIANTDWECLAVLVDRFAMLEFFPATSKLDSYQLILNLDRMVNRIKASKDTSELFHILTQEFQRHADYDRVMLYRFLPDWSGEVVAESVSDRTEVKFLGMRFPAEDIPKQARELYKNSALRIMADVEAEPAALVPELLPTGRPLDQSVSVLRGMSLMHLAYLRNMGVKASMSIALMSGDKLWGLVAFHHYSAKVPPNHLVSEMKASCELFADIVISHLHPALNLEVVKRSVSRKHALHRIFQELKETGQQIEALQEALASIYSIIDKAYVGVCLSGRCYYFSEDKQWQPTDKLSDALQRIMEKQGGNWFVSEGLLAGDGRGQLPESPGMAGILILRSESLPELSVFFGAKEVVREIIWGGKPKTVDIVLKNGERSLEPRGSFDLWREKVVGHSDDWQEEDRQLLKELLFNCEEYILHSKSEQVKSALHKSSYSDPLTGLPNRRFLERYIKTLPVSKNQRETLTVYFIDLDNFKRINDYLGHSAGDRLLKVIADRLKSAVRPDDVVARLGGDEFVVVIRHAAGGRSDNEKTARNIAAKIIGEVGRPIIGGEQAMITTPSVGAVMCDPRETTFLDVLKRADIAMYRAKNAGKNCVHFFSEEDQSEVNYDVQIEIDLRECLKNGELDVHYQCKVDRQRRVVGAEALARWKHPKFGAISPDVFISVAEKNNLIVELGAQVLDAACQQMVLWKSLPQFNDISNMAVNISPAQILSPGFEQQLRAVLSRYGLPMSALRLEITENLFMQNFEESKGVLQSLRKSGATISLDDFGTGYSSLSYLWKLPIDEVKVDKSFIASMADDDESMTMVEGIISLCKKLNLKVVAEGVEDKVQLALLRGMGCDVFQGYYFGRPVPADKFKFSVSP